MPQLKAMFSLPIVALDRTPELKLMFSLPGPRFCLDASAKVNVFVLRTSILLGCLMFSLYGPRFCSDASAKVNVFVFRISILLGCLNWNQCFHTCNLDFDRMSQLKSRFSHLEPRLDRMSQLKSKFSHLEPRFWLNVSAEIKVFTPGPSILIRCLS